MSRILILAKATMLENARKQVFHVVTLITLTIVCASTMLSFFTLGVQVKMLKDLCMTSILFCGGLLAIALASTSLPNEIENKTCYPILARPLRRTELLLGKYLGSLFTVYLGLAAIALVFTLLLASKQALDARLILSVGFTLLEVAVIAAVSTFFSTFTTPAVAAMLSFIVYVVGTVKIGYFKPLVDQVTNPAAGFLARAAYHMLPNLESFNFKDALVHKLNVPETYLIQVAIYGVLYCVLVLSAGAYAFSRREL